MINHAFWSLGWATDPRPVFGARSLSKIDACIDRVEVLVKHGAKWKPEPDSHRYSRRHIRHLEPDRILRLFSILLEHQATEVELLEKLVATPTMRKHLGEYARKIDHLFHPPPPKPIKTGAAAAPERPKEPQVKATVPEMTARAEAYLLDLVKESAGSPFWSRSSLTYLDNQKVRRVLGMAKDDERSRLEIFESAAARVNRKARNFEVSVDGKVYRGSVSTISISLAGDDHEWSDVFDELLSDRRDENPRRISKPARELLFWLREHGSSDGWLDDQAINEGVGWTDEHGSVVSRLQELEKKLGPLFQFETRSTGNGTEARTEHRAWLDTELAADSLSADIPVPVSLNPVFAGSLGNLTKREVDRWCEVILDHILAVRPTGTVPVYFLWITTDKELGRLFPSRDRGTRFWDNWVVDLISALPLPDSFLVEYDFENPLHWFTRMVPVRDWSASLQVLEGIRSQPSLQERYGLSEDAARLLKWIEELPKEKFLGEWTPTVEDRMEKKIGIKCPWDDGNIPAYIQFLLDEINGKTSFDLSVQPWKYYSSWQTRIRVRKKQSEEAKLIQSIQLLGLQRGKLLSEDTVRDLLARLLE